jgi:GNAT superfamily N-acetyltransferase
VTTPQKLSPAVDRLEQLTLSTWPPEMVGFLAAGWVMTADLGETGRANSCWPLEWHGGPDDLDEAIDAVERWYQKRELSPRFKLIERHPDGLERILKSRGYTPSKPTVVMTAPIVSVSTDAPVRLSDDPGPDLSLAVAEEAKTKREAQERLGIARRTPRPRRFASLYTHDLDLAAVGVGVIADGALGVYMMRTREIYRRRGCADAILAGLFNWALSAKTTEAFLQVEEANTPARALYARWGFETRYTYAHWSKP